MADITLKDVKDSGRELLDMYTSNDMLDIGRDILAHHGIDGQKWGVRNGPPYPLNDEGKASFRDRLKARHAINKEIRKLKKAKKRRDKILKDPKKIVKYQNEFTTSEIYQALDKIKAVDTLKNATGLNAGKQKPVKLSKKQKRMADHAATLLQNYDHFTPEELDLAYERLKGKEALRNTLVNSLNRPATAMNIGYNILDSAVGIGRKAMNMHDMYNTVFGGATYDESHKAWLGNNKEPVSGKVWSEFLGETNSALRGEEYKFRNAAEREADRTQARADKLYREAQERYGKYTEKYQNDRWRKAADIKYNMYKDNADRDLKRETDRQKAQDEYDLKIKELENMKRNADLDRRFARDVAKSNPDRVNINWTNSQPRQQQRKKNQQQGNNKNRR